MENIARKNVDATGYRTRDLQITSQTRYQLSYPAGSESVEQSKYGIPNEGSLIDMNKYMMGHFQR